MRLVARRSLPALAIFLGAAFADAAALNSNSACSMDKMERDPSSVIAPCSALLNENDISPEQRAQALFVRGSAYHRTGRPDIAAPDYDEALKLDRNNDEIYIARANAALLDQHDFAEAVVRVALKNRARLYEQTSRYDLARRDLDAAVNYKAVPEALVARGEFLWKQRGQDEEALKDLEAATALDPNDSRTHDLR